MSVIAHAIKSQQENRALLKKRKFKDIKKLVHKESGKTELQFKEVSAAEMAIIKKEIRKKAKYARTVEIMIYAISISIVLAFFSLLLYTWV